MRVSGVRQFETYRNQEKRIRARLVASALARTLYPYSLHAGGRIGPSWRVR